MMNMLDNKLNNKLHDNSDKCPTCGGKVKVHSSDEGTGYFEPISESADPGLRQTHKVNCAECEMLIFGLETKIDEKNRRISELEEIHKQDLIKHERLERQLKDTKELSDLRLRDLTEFQRKLLKAEKLAATIWMEKESK